MWIVVIVLAGVIVVHLVPTSSAPHHTMHMLR
jgi:hypothetical protein